MMKCAGWLALATAGVWFGVTGSALAQQVGAAGDQLPDLPSGAAAGTQVDVENNLDIEQQTTERTTDLPRQDRQTTDPIGQNLTDEDSGEVIQRETADRAGDEILQRGRDKFLDRLGMPISAEVEGELTVSALPIDSVAAEAGLRQGDRLVSINGQTFTTKQELNQFLAGDPGDRLEVVVLRDGARETILIDVAEINVAGNAAAAATDVERPALGITLRDDRGMLFVRDVVPGSPGEEVGLRPGDQLLSLNGQPFRETNDFIAAVAALQPGDQVELVVGRARETYAVMPVLASWWDVYADPRIAQLNDVPPRPRMAMRPDFEYRDGPQGNVVGQLQNEIEQLRQEVRELRQEVHRLNGSHGPADLNPPPTSLPNPDLE